MTLWRTPPNWCAATIAARRADMAAGLPLAHAGWWPYQLLMTVGAGSMARPMRRIAPLLAAVAALAGCVDMFTQAPADSPAAWSGTTTVGNPDFPECGSFLFELAQYQP